MLAIIGGTGIYQLEGVEPLQANSVTTPFGEPSGKILTAKVGDQTVLFMPRHGEAHQLLPHEINYRANIWALKSLGATELLGISAVGSLRESLAPGQLVVPDQYFDFVKGAREKSFFGNGLAAHVSTAEPTCPALTQRLAVAAKQLGESLIVGGTYAGVDGPRLGTRAESLFLRGAGCDLVGMTNVPEAFLAREAQLCYATLGVVTDFDCWRDDRSEHVSVEQVISRYGESLVRAKALLAKLLQHSGVCTNPCACRTSLSSAVLTPVEALKGDQRALLTLLQQ